MAPRTILLILFALSGAAGLAYETLWLRALVLIFGSTVVALGTILAAFLGGLAAGSLAIGHWTRRSDNPLRLYGVLEIGVGLSALVLPFLFRAVEGVSASASGESGGASPGASFLRFVIVFAILALPTVLMGGTLPAMARHFVKRERDLGREGGILYFANTGGAVAGTILTAFVLIPALGVSRTNLVAVACNLIVGAAVLVISSRPQRTAALSEASAPAASPDAAHEEEEGGTPEPARAQPPANPWTVYSLYALVGFAALALEVFWTRALLLSLGTTVYAFSTLLATYLLGLALGGLFGARAASRTERPLRLLGLLIGAAGLAVLLGNRVLGTLPLHYLRLQFALGLGWNASVLVKFLLAFVVMLPATFFLGAAFPVALRAVGGVARDSGLAVGRLYAANTSGSIVGSLLAGLALIPLLGIERGLVTMAVLFLVASLAFFVADARRIPRVAIALYAVAVVASLVFPSWDRYLQRSGVYFYAAHYRKIDEFLKARRDYTILSYREGPEATVAVVDGQRYRYLQINGKTDASTGKDMITQVISAHLPILFQGDPKNVLVIGLGSGVTAGSVARYPVESIQCVEISPEVVEAASLFAEANGDVLNDPRLRVSIADGRNFLRRTKERFDVIISEPSNPWIAGVGNLFTREFLELAKSRLAPGGVMCQWTNLYDLSESDLAIMLATYREAFPQGAIFLSHLGDLLLIGTDAPPRLDFGRLVASVSDPKVNSDLTRVGIANVYDLLGNFITTTEGLAPFIPPGTPVHTDDRAQLEFSAPKSLYGDYTLVHLSKILSIHRPIVPLLDGVPSGPDADAVRRAVTQGAAARNFFLQGVLQARSGQLPQGVESLRQARTLSPSEENIGESLAEYLALLAETLAQEGQRDAALPLYREAIDAAPKDARYPYYYAMAIKDAEPDRAIEILGEVIRRDPKLREARIGLALTLASAGRQREALYQLEILIDARPDDTSLLRMRGDVAATEGDFATAMKDYLRALEIDEGDRDARSKLAFAYARTGRADLAVAEYQRLRRDAPQDVPTLFNLAMLLTQEGRMKDAARVWEALVAIEPANEEFRRNLALVKEGKGPTS